MSLQSLFGATLKDRLISVDSAPGKRRQLFLFCGMYDLLLNGLMHRMSAYFLSTSEVNLPLHLQLSE